MMPRRTDRRRQSSKSEDAKSSPHSRLPHNVPSSSMAIMDIPERPPALEFITLTERPANQKSNFSYIVRSHAMQSVVHERKNPQSKKATIASNHSAEVETKTSKELSGKFKLNTWSKKKRRRKDGPTQKDEETNALNTSITTALHSYGSLPIATSAHRTQQLLYHYNTGFVVNAFAINYDDAWKPFSTTDPALLHATLCLVAQHEDLVRGIEDSSVNLFHKGEVMSLMNSRLRDDSYLITDADITSVALLVILETINGSFEAATAHKIGLLEMVNICGGIWCFERNPVVVRVLSWSDIAYSTRFGTLPEYTSLASELDISAEPFPQDLSPLPLNEHDTRILQTLRQISYLVSLPNITPFQKEAATSTAINTEYLILTATVPLTPDSSPEVVLSQAFILASLIYLHLTFRLLPSFPNPSKLHLRLISTIHSLLSSIPPSYISSPQSIDLFTWITFVCSAASGRRYSRHDVYPETDLGLEKRTGVGVQDFVQQMRRVESSVVKHSKAQVRQRLRNVVWREGVCDKLHDEIWKLIEEMGRKSLGES